VGPLLGATVMLSGGIFVAGGVTELGSFEALALLGLGLAIGAGAGAALGLARRDVRGWLVFGAAIGLAVGWLVFLHQYIGASQPSAAVVPAAEGAQSALDPILRAATLRNIDTVFIGLAVF